MPFSSSSARRDVDTLVSLQQTTCRLYVRQSCYFTLEHSVIEACCTELALRPHYVLGEIYLKTHEKAVVLTVHPAGYLLELPHTISLIMR